MIVLAPAALAAQPTEVERVQAALDDWVAERARIGGVTGIAAYVSFGDAGADHRGVRRAGGPAPDDGPRSTRTRCFHMGSTSKAFARGGDPQARGGGQAHARRHVGQWLPQYPAWGDVSIRRLLSMTSGIPNYSETEIMSRPWVEEPERKSQGGGARGDGLSHRDQRSAGTDRLPLLQHELHPRGDDRGQCGWQALSRPGAGNW